MAAQADRGRQISEFKASMVYKWVPGQPELHRETLSWPSPPPPPKKKKKDGVSYKAWGENIAYIGGNISADALAERFMTNWMNSSGHRENILSTNF